MQNLVEVLNELIAKYKMSDEDVAMIQEALAMLENDGSEEFAYVEE